MQKTLIHALEKSGEILKDNFGKIEGVDNKHNQSHILTQADLDSERAIVRIIKKEFPDHNLIAEESGFINNSSPYTWVIDPLDGTSNFAAGINWFGTIICVLENFKPLLAGVYLPIQNDLYLAQKERGATKNNNNILVSKEKNLKNVLVAYSLDYSKDLQKTEAESRIIKSIVQNVRNLRSTNSLIDLCLTADGRLGGCINQATNIWDIAAPSLLIQEAGGKTSDINGKDINFSVNQKNFDKNFTIVGSNKILHPKLIDLIQNH